MVDYIITRYPRGETKFIIDLATLFEIDRNKVCGLNQTIKLISRSCFLVPQISVHHSPIKRSFTSFYLGSSDKFLAQK